MAREAGWEQPAVWPGRGGCKDPRSGGARALLRSRDSAEYSPTAQGIDGCLEMESHGPTADPEVQPPQASEDSVLATGISGHFWAGRPAWRRAGMGALTLAPRPSLVAVSAPMQWKCQPVTFHP